MSSNEKLRRPLGPRRHAVELRPEQRGLADERRHRRAQLVRHVRGEAPLTRPCLREGIDLLLERLGHLVERRCPRAELVVCLHRKPSLEETLRERVRRHTGLADRAEDPPSRERAGGRCEHDHDAPPRQEDRPQLREVVAQGRLREEEVELGLRRWGPSAGNEVRRVGDPHTLEGEVALPHQASYPSGDVGSSDANARRERLSVGQCDRLDAASLGVELEDIGGALRFGGLPKDGSREHQVRACLRERAVNRVVEARTADDEVRPERERPGGDRGDEGEGDCEAPPEPSPGDDAPHRLRSSR